mgnify:CR=1 FL=1
MKPRPPIGQLIIYAIGQFGWALASFSVAFALIYFYAPPDDGSGTTFPVFIPGGSIFLGLTLIGIIGFGGRILDGFTDPLIASYSDKTTGRMGKRKKLMALSVLPFALFAFLVFLPLSDSIAINAVWLVIAIVIYYISFTGYLIPYTALISELGHHPDDRLKISMLISVAFALGVIGGSQIYSIQSTLEASFSSTIAFQLAVVGMSVLALILMLVPIIFLNENKYAVQGDTAPSLSASLKIISKNRNFKLFVLSDLLYWLALTFIQLGMVYFVTLLFGMNISKATTFLEMSFIISFLFYFLVFYLHKRVGKKALMVSGFLVFIFVFAVLFFLPFSRLGMSQLFYSITILTAYALAVFGVLPNVIIADIVNEEEAKTGQSLAAVFYGARNFMMKMGISVANLLFPSFLLLGKSIDNPAGVRYSVLAAMVFSIMGLLIFLKFKDEPAISK